MTEFDRTASGYESSRNFVNWFFTKSHPRLLLWSEKGNTHQTRIEVLFTDVAVVNLPVYMAGLKIVPAIGAAARAEFRRIPKQMTWDNKTLFRMSGTDWEGYVIASVLQVAEADRGFEAPSDLLEPLWSSPFPRAPADSAGR